MRKVFLDTNIILDLLLDRKPFSDDVAHLLEIANELTIQICVSAVTITDVYYVVAKFEGSKVANTKTAKILELVAVESVGHSTVTKSSKSDFEDFEDGVQNFCAIESKHKIIVTRNTKDFKRSKLSIMTPKEYISKIEARH